jgi:hypothetical protein
MVIDLARQSVANYKYILVYGCPAGQKPHSRKLPPDRKRNGNPAVIRPAKTRLVMGSFRLEEVIMATRANVPRLPGLEGNFTSARLGGRVP